MKTAIISSKTSVNHLTGDGHPEQPKRVTAITERLKKNKSLIWDKPASFDQNILKKVHDVNYVDIVFLPLHVFFRSPGSRGSHIIS